MDLISAHEWTASAADWWDCNSYGLGLDEIAAMLDTAKRIALHDGRGVICRNDLEAARMQVGG